MEHIPEHLDIYDDQGKNLGFTAPRDRAHREGLWHRTVHVWVITPQGQVILQKRSRTKDFNPGLWDISCAGHIAAGDSSRNAAVRELYEELGLQIDSGMLEYLFMIKHQSTSPDATLVDNEFSEVYLVCTCFTQADLTPQLSEVDEIKMVPLEDLRHLLATQPHDFVRHDEEYGRVLQIMAERIDRPGRHC